VAVAFLYCSYAERHDQTIEQLLGSLIRQLLEQSVITNDILELYDSQNRSKTQLDLAKLSACLRSITASFTKIYIVIDALDECGGADKTRSILLAQLQSLERHVQLFFTSRPLEESESLHNAIQFKVIAQDDDIRSYLSIMIQQESRLVDLCTKHSSLEGEIIDIIIAKAHGMLVLKLAYRILNMLIQ
jgi:hypothetical protein